MRKTAIRNQEAILQQYGKKRVGGGNQYKLEVRSVEN